MEFDPVHVGSKVRISCFRATKQSTYHKPLFVTPLLRRHHHRKNGKRLFTSYFCNKANYPIFPVVTFRDIVWEQGQKASSHLVDRTLFTTKIGQAKWHQYLVLELNHPGGSAPPDPPGTARSLALARSLARCRSLLLGGLRPPRAAPPKPLHLGRLRLPNPLHLGELRPPPCSPRAAQ